MSGRGVPRSGEERLPPLAPGQVRVRALHGAISRGTEALIAAGRVPESEYTRMRAPFMDGAFPFPVKYGYATVGRVVAAPEDRAATCSAAPSSRCYPHQTMFDVPAGHGGAAAGRRAAAARDAFGQHGDGAERDLGRRAGAVRLRRGGRARAWSARWSASCASGSPAPT